MSIFKDIVRALGFGNSDNDLDDEPADAGSNTPLNEEAYTSHVETQRAGKDQFFKHHPHSPLSPEERSSFEGLNYYPPDPTLRLNLALEPAETIERITMQTTTDGEQVFDRIGYVSFDVDGEPARLAVYRPADGGELFIPFRDTTSGNDTYGAGRYLEPHGIADDTILVDFNEAYNPFCAYNEEYSCPLPPIENWLKVPIRAGEKKYEPNHEINPGD